VTAWLLLLGVVAGEVPDAGLAVDLAPVAAPMDADRGEASGGVDAPADPATVAGLEGGVDAATVDGEARAWLRGLILATGSRGPVLGARVTVTDPPGGQAAETDDDGRFALALPCGRHVLAARAPGYEPASFERDACSDAAPFVLRLAPRPNLPVYETVVVAPRDEPSVELRGPELTTTPGSLGDPFRTIESLPGVAAVAWPAPVYAVRGSNPGNTGYFLDDLQVPLLFHLLLGPAVIHPALFDGMSFYPGGYPARYGRYVAGIVAARTRAAAEDRVHATAEARLYDAGALVSVPFPDGNGGAAAAFRYSYTGILLSLLRNDVRLSYWDYQLRADRRWRGWRLTLLVLGSNDDLLYRPQDFLGAELSPTGALGNLYKNQRYLLRFHRASLRVARSVGLGQLWAVLAFGADESTAPLAQVLPISLSSYSLLPRLAYQRSSVRVDWEAGADGQVQWFRPQSTVVEAGGSDIAQARTAVLASAYLSATVRAHERLTLTPGLRFDAYAINGVTRGDLGPRLSARVALDAETWLTASGGRFSQAPSLAVQIPAAESFGLVLYGLQTSWQAAVGVGTRYLRGLEAEATGYVQRYVLSDLRDPALLDPDPLAADFLVRRDARSYGVEVMIRRPLAERLHGWLSYTLSRSQRALGGGVIGPSDWDQRHILNLVVGYRLGRTTLGARGHFHSGQPVLVESTQAEAFVRLPAFYQLDLRIERRVLFDAFTLDLYAEVVNTTMTRMVYGLRQDPATGARDEYSLRLFLPSVGIRAEL
jgi:hypothetical protein